MKLPNSVNRAALSLTFIITKSHTHTTTTTHITHTKYWSSSSVQRWCFMYWLRCGCDRCINLDEWTDGVASWVTQLQLGMENKDIPLCMMGHFAVVENDAHTHSMYTYWNSSWDLSIPIFLTAWKRYTLSFKTMSQIPSHRHSIVLRSALLKPPLNIFLMFAPN